MTVTVAFDLSNPAVNAFNTFAAKQRTGIQTALSAAIDNTTTSVTVDSAAGIAAADAKGAVTAILIDSEIITVSSITGTTVTVVRGALGTTAASHSSGAEVQVLKYAGHHRYLIFAAGEAYKAVISQNDATYQAAQQAAIDALESTKAAAVS